MASQVAPLVDVASESSNPLGAAATAVGDPSAWQPAALALGLGTVLFLVLARRLGPLFPAAPLVAVIGLLVGLLTAYPGALLGKVPASSSLRHGGRRCGEGCDGRTTAVHLSPSGSRGRIQHR